MIPYILCFAAGTFAGSFFYTLALRYVDGSIKTGPVRALFSRSKCPVCGKAIPAVYLVPLAGYIFCRGRCHSCGWHIPASYPAAEAGYGLLAVAVAHFLGRDAYSLAVYAVCSLCVCVSIIDIRTMIIPPSLVIVLFLFSMYPVIMQGNILNSLYGFLLLSVFFLVMMFIFPGSFGGGDLKLYAVSGFMFGLEMSVVLLEVSLVTGAVFGVFWAVMRGGNFRMKMPFAPFITAGIIITFLFGSSILLLYYRLFYSF